MNMKQVWGVLGGFFFAYLAITLTNKPAIQPKNSAQGGTEQAVVSNTGTGGQSDATQSGAASQSSLGFQKGFCFPAIGAEALSQEASDSALTAIAATGAQWVAITPVFYQASASASKVTVDPEKTPSAASLAHAIQKCRQLGLKVMLKPLVSSGDGARRESFYPLDPATWMASYTEALQPYLTVAAENGVEVVCLGSSYSRTEANLPWGELIAKARSLYTGKLTYGASHRSNGEGGYKQVPFWKDLDYVGIEAFFPLTSHAVPSQTDLEEGWQQAAGDIEQWLSTMPDRKPVVFTSLGYASLVGGATEPDRLPPGAQDDPTLQATAYEAFFSQVYRRPWLEGAYWFGWTNPALAGAAGEANPYSIEGKPAFEVVKAHYGESR